MPSFKCKASVFQLVLTKRLILFLRDWKKLTFYYFAEAYVNFNSLVTDLFKIYKTRIWMSAINPASFMSPTANIQLSTVLPVTGTPENGQYHEIRAKPDNRFSSVPVSDAPQSTFDYAWNTSILGHAPSSTISQGFGHFLPGNPHGIPLANVNTMEYGRDIYPPIRSQSPFGLQSYNAGIGVRRSPRSDLKHIDEPASTSYPDHLQTIHGLSLGT